MSLKSIFYHTIGELRDEDFDVDRGAGTVTFRHLWSGKLVKRKIHASTITFRGKRVEYVFMGGVKYFIV